ncbi:hypothetical protein [Paenibacillus sp. FSL M8-0142]|uniref:hypothetical protein n=1 Tax=Paenibacillus sp. FSL M8-0142 TaxID=2954525 RepID=UPI00315ADD88
MTENQKPNETQLTDSRSIAEAYSSADLLRVIMQSIPTIGPILDVFLAMPGTRIREERLQFFISTLFEAVQKLEGRIDLHIAETEEFHDSVWRAIESSLNSRTKNKIIMNVMILSNILTVKTGSVIDPEDYLKLVAELSPIESRIVALFHKIYKDDTGTTESENNLQRATRLEAQKIIASTLGIEDSDDLYFQLKRLERTGLIREITGTFFGYTGGSFAPTKLLDRLMEYLSYSRFQRSILQRCGFVVVQRRHLHLITPYSRCGPVWPLDRQKIRSQEV